MRSLLVALVLLTVTSGAPAWAELVARPIHVVRFQIDARDEYKPVLFAAFTDRWLTYGDSAGQFHFYCDAGRPDAGVAFTVMIDTPLVDFLSAQNAVVGLSFSGSPSDSLAIMSAPNADREVAMQQLAFDVNEQLFTYPVRYFDPTYISDTETLYGRGFFARSLFERLRDTVRVFDRILR